MADGRARVLDGQRWNRLVVLHLLVMAFINDFGYKWQRRSVSDFRLAVSHITDFNVARVFARSIPSVGLPAVGWPDLEPAHEPQPNWSIRHVDQRWDRVLKRLQCLELPPIGAPERLVSEPWKHPYRAARAWRWTHTRRPNTATLDVLLREAWRQGALLRCAVQATGVEGGAGHAAGSPFAFHDRVIALWQEECLVIGLDGAPSDADESELRRVSRDAPVRLEPTNLEHLPDGVVMKHGRSLEPTELRLARHGPVV